MRWRFLAAAIAVFGCFLALDTSVQVFWEALRHQAKVSQARTRTAEEWVQELQNTSDTTSRARAADTLWQFGPTIVPQVAPCLRHSVSQVRIAACIALSRMGPAAASAVPDLMELLGDSTEPARLPAIWALESIGQAAHPAIEILAAAADDKDPNIQEAAIRTLVKLGEPACPTLVGLLNDGDLQARTLVVDELAKLSVNCPAVCDSLVALATDSAADLQQSVFVALAAQGAAAVQGLMTPLHDENSAVRAEAAIALCKIGADAQAAAPVLLDALNDNEANVRFWALRALTELNLAGSSVRDKVIAALDDPDADVRWQAADTIARAGLSESGFALHRRNEPTHQ